MAMQYVLPNHWIKYDLSAVVMELTEAKAAVLSLTSIPFQRAWAEALQEMELKREVAGTSKIEGADFTDRELDEAIGEIAPQEDLTRSQKQARAAVRTYRWLASVPRERPINEELIKHIHRLIVTGCDDDHCQPGELRRWGHNVTFGRPRHRGVEGGTEAHTAFKRLIGAVNQEFQGHDLLIQSLALHYHVGAMHPFDDGNGRTARALEAMMLQRAQLKDSLFIAMSNYYYDEKDTYLVTLSEVRARSYDLTAFLKFGLRGIAVQCKRLLREITRHISKSLYRDVMHQMYGRLRSTRKRALADRQIAILQYMLYKDSPVMLGELLDATNKHYSGLAAGAKAVYRDINHLIMLRAIHAEKQDKSYKLTIRLEWPTEITETEFYKEIDKLPAAKTRLAAYSSY
ncbi:MAG: Fic family protein [Xanthobacteraceae bacterium]